MKKLNLQQKMELQYLTLVLPAFVLFTIGIIVPIVLCLYYSFTEWDGFSAHIQFVNIQNYINIFRDKSVMSSWAFTIKFAVLNAGIADMPSRPGNTPYAPPPPPPPSRGLSQAEGTVRPRPGAGGADRGDRRRSGGSSQGF